MDEVKAFYVGLAALQVGDDVRADTTLEQATQLAPGEPAAWANWGLLALRQGNFDAAAKRLGQAQNLAPKNGQLHYLSGVLESKRGNPGQAIAELRKSVQMNPHNLRALYLLAQEVERQGDANGETEFQQLLQEILAAQPDNPAALLELGRVAAKRGDAQTLHSVVAGLNTHAATWPPEVQQQWTALQAAATGPDPRTAAVRIAFLRNSLMRVPEFRQSLNQIQPTAGNEATPFLRFLVLPSPTFTPPPADTAITFQPAPMTAPAPKAGTLWTWLGAISLTGEGAPAIAAANSHSVKLSTGAELPFPGGPANATLQPESILPIDFNYDFKTDLVLAGEGGVRFDRQESPTSFMDVTAQTKLPPALLNAAYTGAWAIDIEADGDMDILLAAHQASPLGLRNNGDGTFTPIHPFNGISGLRGLAWVDLDDDGNPDAALIDGAGTLHFFHNQRGGVFSEVPLPANLPPVKALAVADVSSSGTLDLVAIEVTGALVAINRAGDAWKIAPLGNAPHLSTEVRLHAADLDNNGAVDLVLMPVALNPGDAPGAVVWLNSGDQKFTLVPAAAGSARVFDIADLNADGRLDLLGLSPNGEAQQGLNHGSKNYHWQILRPRARVATGDQRVNSFGIGGEMDVRSGLLVQKQPITSPQLHFGLGDQSSVDVVTILWPNGMQNAEFALKADQQVLTEQRLKGSCPFLFAWNGKQMSFVKDAVPWGSAIGLQIDSVGTPGIAATEEWYKINRDQLAPHDGYYDLRLTGELWETYYYDYLKLMVVDHPAGTEIFTDERFVVPAPKLAITSVAPPHNIAKATDDQGADVTAIVTNLDGNYLDTFGRGQYQGLTRDHYVELDLGDDVPRSGPLWLLAKGWVHPTDSSVNVAIGQGHHQKAEPLSLEVPDGRGGWHTARANLGFPAGRKKTCLINLENVFPNGAPHKLRLRTNLEVYWDQIQWAVGLPRTQLKIARLDPSQADLHYRGYSVVNQANPSSPELPNYNRIAASTQIWRDLEGYYTRYGDVRPLLSATDDRYVIMNAGDEISLRFPQQPPPPSGWVRDYVIAGDGWIKDGDYNTLESRTIQPLPYHAKTQYNHDPGSLESERVYRQHPEDWQTYHTRYVTPEPLDHALRSRGAQ